jgi:hypothetical protein
MRSAGHSGFRRLRAAQGSGLTALFGLIAAVVTTPWASPLDRDGAVYIALSRLEVAGRVPYLDIEMSKPPLFHLLMAQISEAARVTGLDIAFVVRLAYVVIAVLAAVLASRIASRYGVGRPGQMITAVGTAALLASAAWAHGGGLSEPPAILFALGALSIALDERPSLRGSVAIGLLAAASVGCSLLMVGPLLGLGLVVINRRWIRMVPAMAGSGLLLAALVVAPIAVAGGFLAMKHELVDFNGALGTITCPLPNGNDNWPCYQAIPALTDLFITTLAIGVFSPLAGLRLLTRFEFPLPLAAAAVGATALAVRNIARTPDGYYLLPALLFDLLLIVTVGSLVRRGRGRSLLADSYTAVLGLLCLGFVFLTVILGGLSQSGRGPDLSRELASARPIFVWGGLTSEAIMDRQTTYPFLVENEFLTPGYADGQLFERLCVMFQAQRPIIIESSAPVLAVHDPVPNGLSNSAWAGFREFLASGWDASGPSTPRTWWPREGPTLNPAICRG